MMHVRRTQYALLLTLLGTAAFGADVYRSIAPDGTVVYTDRPEGENSELVFSVSGHTPAPVTTTAARTAATAAAAPAAAAVPTAPAVPEGPSAAELRAQRQKNCETAREMQERFAVSRRLYRTDAAGERVFLSDEEVAEARLKAAADVKDWCG